MALPPTPQNASRTTSQRHRSAICVAIASGVTLYHPSSSSKQPSSYLEKYRVRWAKSALSPHSLHVSSAFSYSVCCTHIFGGGQEPGRHLCRKGQGLSHRRLRFRVPRDPSCASRLLAEFLSQIRASTVLYWRCHWPSATNWAHRMFEGNGRDQIRSPDAAFYPSVIEVGKKKKLKKWQTGGSNQKPSRF